MERLRAVYNGYLVYNAGFPSFQSNFSRDSFMSGILLNNAEFLREQLIFSSKLQGTKTNPITGEEPGKVHHEYIEAQLRNRSTLYNACDTTALYLCGMETYLALTNDYEFIKVYSENIESAVEYILSHSRSGLFLEDPGFSGADKFALKVTYWKDSQLPCSKEEPEYPIVYTLAHFQNIRALKSAATLLKQSKLLHTVDTMMEAGFKSLWNGENFVVAIDRAGPIESISSDSLHIFAYLDSGNFEECVYASKVEKLSKVLETPCGYRAIAPASTGQMKDKGHSGDTVWGFEQAFIHYGAKKFHLSQVEEVSHRVRLYLDTDPEILGFNASDNRVFKLGCDPQLWTIAAKHYFDRKTSLAVL